MRSESRLHGCWNASWRFRNIRCQTVVSPKKYGKTTWVSELNLQIWGAHHFRRNPDKDWAAITKCWSCWSIIYAYLWYNYIRALGKTLTMYIYTVCICIYIYIHTVYIYMYVYVYVYVYICIHGSQIKLLGVPTLKKRLEHLQVDAPFWPGAGAMAPTRGHHRHQTQEEGPEGAITGMVWTTVMGKSHGPYGFPVKICSLFF